jgi:hypothetical protein
MKEIGPIPYRFLDFRNCTPTMLDVGVNIVLFCRTSSVVGNRDMAVIAS